MTSKVPMKILLLPGKSCPHPGTVPFGAWYCEEQEVPVKGITSFDEDAQSYPGTFYKSFLFISSTIWGDELFLLSIFPALQCRLECDSGYIAQRTPLITCVNGEYAKRVSLSDEKD